MTDRLASELRASGAGGRVRPVDAWWTSARARDVGMNLAVGSAYLLVAQLTMWPAASLVRITPMWAPTGVALAAVLLAGPRVLPGIALAAFITAAISMSPLSAVLVALGMTLQLVVDVRLLGYFGFDARLRRVRDPLVLCGVTLVGAAAAGVFGGLAMAAANLGSSGWSSYHVWFSQDWLGALIVGSLVLTWAKSRPIAWTWARVLEGVAVLAALVLSSQVKFRLWALFPNQSVPMAFLFFPLVGYAGLRFGPAGASTLIALVAALEIQIAALGMGPFATFSQEFTMFLLHVFLLLAWLSGQSLAAVRAEWEDALQRRLALEEQLRHSQKMEAVGRLAGGIAHDFNNLLTAIIGYAEIVMVSLGPDDSRRADAEEIARAAMRAADLTRQMLAFSRRQILQPQVIDLHATLTRIEPMLRRVIGEDIVLTIVSRAVRPHVQVDPSQIEQVIMNLVVNARDAMPNGGRLTLETYDVTLDEGSWPHDLPSGQYVVLAVSDTGVGMTSETRARVFEPYFTTKAMGKGTGLGLSTAYGIVRQSEGHIQVFSEPGQGTTFRISLPRAACEAPVVKPAADEAMPSGTEHILLIEDDASVRRLTREILVRLGYSVTEASSGRAGLALGSDETKQFDLVLSDVILGDMHGPAVFEALRALRPNVRVLYMSGYANDTIVHTGLVGDDQPFLPKPFTPRDLAVTIREILDLDEGSST